MTTIDVADTLRQADQYRNATALLSRDFKNHVGLKRELDAAARELQARVDRFVRHSAEETHRFSYGLDTVKNEFREFHSQLSPLREACRNAERLCEDAKLKRDRLATTLTQIRRETSSVIASMEQYLTTTRSNIAPLEAQLVRSIAELHQLEDERRMLLLGLPN